MLYEFLDDDEVEEVYIDWLVEQTKSMTLQEALKYIIETYSIVECFDDGTTEEEVLSRLTEETEGMSVKEAVIYIRNNYDIIDQLDDECHDYLYELNHEAEERQMAEWEEELKYFSDNWSDHVGVK